MCTKYKNGIQNASICHILGQVSHKKYLETTTHGKWFSKEVF